MRVSPKPICILLLSRDRLTTGSWLNESNTTTTTQATRAADLPRACVCVCPPVCEQHARHVGRQRFQSNCTTAAVFDTCNWDRLFQNNKKPTMAANPENECRRCCFFFCMHACIILSPLSSCCHPADVTALQFLSLISQKKKKKHPKGPEQRLDDWGITM